MNKKGEKMKKQCLLAKIAVVAVFSAATSAVWAGDCMFKGGHYEASSHTLYLESYADTLAELVLDQAAVNCLNQNNPSNMDIVILRDSPLKSTSTIALPFAVDLNDECINAYEVNDFGPSNGTWEILASNAAGNLNQNQPYIISVLTNNSACQNRTEIHLKSKGSFSVPAQDQRIVKPLCNYANNYQADFELTGTLKYIKWDKEKEPISGIYGYAAKDKGDVSGGQFVKVGSGAYLPPLRAYLKYVGKDNAMYKKSSDNVKDFELPETINVRLVDGDSVMSVGKLNTFTGEIQMDGRRFDLNGRAINGKPANHGVYVGKQKVVR